MNTKKLNTDQYIYCETCDIWYNQALKQRGDSERSEAQKTEYPTMSFLIVDCPLCKYKQALSTSLKVHRDSSHHVNLYRKTR